jgi:hypothetical protein
VGFSFTSQPAVTLSTAVQNACLLAYVKRSSGNAKTDIVVPVCSIVPVAVSSPAVIIIVVPGPAAQHSVEAVSEANIAFFKKKRRLTPKRKRKKEKVQSLKG